MKFLIDAQLPPSLCSWLRDRNHQAAHVVDLGLGAASDEQIARQVEIDDTILVSKDEDFMALRLPDRFPLLWLRCGNASNRALTIWLEVRWDQVEALFRAGERLVEVR